MQEAVAPGHHFHDRNLFAHQIPRCLHRVTAHGQQHATSGQLPPPVIGGVRSTVRLTQPHGQDVTNRTVNDHLSRVHHGWTKDLRLSIAVPDAGSTYRRQHLAGLRGRTSQRFRDDHRLASIRCRDNDVAVQMIGQPNHDQVNIGALQDISDARRVCRDAPAACKVVGTLGRARVVDNDLLIGHISQPLHIKVGHEPATQHPDSHGHGLSFPFPGVTVRHSCTTRALLHTPQG